jgi:hypothetical protein
MKKTFYLILISIMSSLCITACTEEDVQPNSAVVTHGKESDPK